MTTVLTSSHVNVGGVETGEYIGKYTLPKSGQVNFLWSKNDVTMVIELNYNKTSGIGNILSQLKP